MDDEKKDFLNKFASNKKTLTFIIILGIAGIVLIGISEIFSNKPSDNKSESTKPDNQITFDQDDYTAALEQKLYEIVGAIDGVGDAKIMITLDSSFEYRYAMTKETVTDSPQSSGSGGHQSLKEEYVYIENADGKRQALLISQVLPKIKGVVVVCEGGDTLAVRNNVINAISTVLGTYSNNVYVTKMSSK